MRRLFPLVAFTVAIISIISCRPKRPEATPTSGAETAVEAIPDTDSVTAIKTAVAVIDRLPAGKPVRLCNQKLTSWEYVCDRYSGEEAITPDDVAFYIPRADIAQKSFVRRAQNFFNTIAVSNRVANYYELFFRAITERDPDTVTRQDSLELAQTYQPKVSDARLREAIPDATIRASAKRLLAKYAAFDGRNDDDSPFSKAFAAYVKMLNTLPQIATEEEITRFKDTFWEWYDKRQFIPEIDTIVSLGLGEYTKTYIFSSDSLTKESINHLKAAVESETDIDRRAILALEYAKFEGMEGSVLLGEILESRIYTRYLLECWIAWRAYTQEMNGVSSFSVIDNNYFDQIRAICADTYIRHCLEGEDVGARCLLKNLAFCEVLHRQYWLVGNESAMTVRHLNLDEFIDPRLIPAETD